MITKKYSAFLRNIFLAVAAIWVVGCNSATKKSEGTTEKAIVEAAEAASVSDTMLIAITEYVDTMSFIKLQMNKEIAYITMADSVIPSINDSSIALCVEAAFTGKLLKEFKTTNVGGDYVIDGISRKGYKCNANTGTLYADCNSIIITTSNKSAKLINKAVTNKGTLFQQVLLMENGNNVYTNYPIKGTKANIYRAACIMTDGNFAVIQSKNMLPLKDFIASLIKLGVKDALYLDMGRGWNYGWYRETVNSKAIELFNYRTPYQTNWLVIKKK